MAHTHPIISIRDEAPPGFTLRHKFQGHNGYIYRISWSPNGDILASVSSDGTARLWDIKNGKCLRVISQNLGHISAVDWSPTGELIALGFRDRSVVKTFRVDADTPEELNFKVQEGILTDLKWSPDGAKIATASYNRAICIYNAKDGRLLVKLLGHQDGIDGIAWFDTRKIASVSADRTIRIWDAESGLPEKEVHSHVDRIQGISWSPVHRLLACASNDRMISILDVDSYQSKILEGHINSVENVSFSFDGRLLASKSYDGTVRIWRCDNWENVAILNEPTSVYYIWSLAFHPRMAILATLGEGDKVIRVWDLDINVILKEQPAVKSIRYTSAKIVLVGESNVGKSCLAMRLAEDRYPKDEEKGTTHGMRFWPLQPERLSPKAVAPGNERHDIVLWDLGGQDEYRLVHQLFLHDTSLALVLFDPTRGRAAFEEAEDWTLRLGKQLKGRKAVKLLIGSKVDAESSLIDNNRVETLIHKHDFVGYYETSAFTGRGIPQLREAIANSLDWDGLGKTSRPELFQCVRDEIETRRRAGDVVLYRNDLHRKVREQFPELYEQDSVEAVIEQLVTQGIIVVTYLVNGDTVLVLQIGEIERYAGSIIIAAKKNPRGVPVLEERDILSPSMLLPGIPELQRLTRDKERIILESVVELLIQNGICFRSQGLLVFPTLFPDTEIDTSKKLWQSASLFYDFTGAIGNIYASMVAWLAIGEMFGAPRLWANWAEFDEPGQGTCGIQLTKFKSGLSHLGLYFDDATTQERRDLFIRFIEDHLMRHGVDVHEHQAIRCCGCGYEISEDIVHENIVRNENDVICPMCRSHTLISEGVAAIRERNPESDSKLIAMRTEIKRRTLQDVEAAKKVMAASSEAPIQTDEPIRILHLSDLHFTGDTSPKTRLQWLIDDITKGEFLGFEKIEYLVISGDVADKGKAEGFERAREFILLLIKHFGLSAERCIFAPGNHDTQDLLESYEWRNEIGDLKPEQYKKQGDIYLVRNEDKYKMRFKDFSDAFFHKIVQQPYPLEYAKQGIAYLFPESHIQFLTLNSCWQIDQFNRKRSGIHPDAVANVIHDADQQVQAAIESKKIDEHDKVLRIGVWHHAVNGPESMANTDFIGHLKNNKVRLCLHGDVHKPIRDLIHHWDPNGIYIIGTGSFGSSPEGRPESTACLYNFLEVQRDFSSIRVHTRSQPETEGSWRGLYEWQGEHGQLGRLPYYEIQMK